MAFINFIVTSDHLKYCEKQVAQGVVNRSMF